MGWAVGWVFDVWFARRGGFKDVLVGGYRDVGKEKGREDRKERRRRRRRRRRRGRREKGRCGGIKEGEWKEDMERTEVGAYGISTMRARADRLHVTVSDSPHCSSWQLLIIKCVSGI